MGGTLSRLRRRQSTRSAAVSPVRRRIPKIPTASPNDGKGSNPGLARWVARDLEIVDVDDEGNTDGGNTDGGTSSDSDSNSNNGSLHPRKPYASAPTLLF